MKNALWVAGLGLLGLGAAAPAGAAGIVYQTLVNSRNPIAYLMLDESGGTTAADSSPLLGGNGTHPGTYAATGVTYGQNSASALLNTAISGNGAVTPVTIPGSAAFDNIGTGDFSVEFWFNTPNITTREDLFTFKGGSSDFGIHLGSQTADQLRLYHNGFIISPANAITANTWHQVAVTRSSGTDTFYLDGVSVGSGADAGSMNTGLAPIELGANTTNSFPYTGLFDELAIYPIALTGVQVQADYAAVPEPGTGLVLLGVAGGLALRGRRQDVR